MTRLDQILAGDVTASSSKEALSAAQKILKAYADIKVAVAQVANLPDSQLKKLFPESVAENIEKTIKEVLMEKGPVICEVMTDENCVFTPKLSSKRLPDGTIQSPSLEDMYPFLSDEEMKENIYTLENCF